MKISSYTRSEKKYRIIMVGSSLCYVVSLLMFVTTLQLFLLSAKVDGFQNHCISPSPSSLVTTIRYDARMWNSNNDDDESLSSLPVSTPSSPISQLEQGAFNPLDYQRNTKTSRSSSSAPPRVDLRSIRMSSLTTDILNSLGDAAAIRTILEDNRAFLLEPLEVEDSMAASGSPIYTPDMSRAERYRAYKRSVDDRLQSSRNEKAKAVLTAMKDYVLEFENESPN